MPLITTVTLLKMVARHHMKLLCSKAFSTQLQQKIFLHSQMGIHHQSVCMKLKPNTSHIISILMGQPMALVQLETLAPLTIIIQKFQTQDHMKFWKNLPLHSHHLLLRYHKL
uniref:Uncharacterized protein pp14328 n=1 Tax=Homo sapiens TaxID=9606 RepID=Q8WYV9_HUMAN|nr:unknown [Homo sapiens]